MYWLIAFGIIQLILMGLYLMAQYEFARENKRPFRFKWKKLIFILYYVIRGLIRAI